MSILDRAVRVLAEADEPLHYRDITQRMQAQGWRTSGRTPWATVNSVLAVEIKDLGPASRVVRTKPGVFAINPTPAVTARDLSPIVAAIRKSQGSMRTDEGGSVVRRFRRDGSIAVLDHAGLVLDSAGGPLHYREITNRMLADGWQTSGQHPWEIVASRLYMDIKNQGAASRFVRTRPGYFTLNPNPAPAPNRARPAPSPVPGEGWGEGSADRPDGQRGVMSFSDAAEHILRESGGQPMHYESITELALDQGLIQTTGLTPAATMYSVIYAENRRREARGQPGRFVMHGKGMVGLGAWVSQGLAAQIETHNRGVREALLARVMDGTPQEFEELVGELLVKLGFEDVAVTHISGDGGIDVRGTLVVGEVVRIRMAVQAKRWKYNVQAPVVQQVRGSLGAHEQGLIITTSDFGSGARAEASRENASPVALMNGEQLAALLAEQQIGVSREQHPLYFLDEPQEPEA